MLRECIHGESVHEQHLRRTLTLTHTITAYSVSGNAVRVRILICATRQTPCRKIIYPLLKVALVHFRTLVALRRVRVRVRVIEVRKWTTPVKVRVSVSGGYSWIWPSYLPFLGISDKIQEA